MMDNIITVTFTSGGASVTWESVESETALRGAEWFRWCLGEISDLLKPAFTD